MKNLRTFSRSLIRPNLPLQNFELKMPPRKRSDCTTRVMHLASLLFLASHAGSENIAYSLAQHFDVLVATNAHEKPSTDAILLPAAASSEVLHFNDNLLSGATTIFERETAFAAILTHETTLRAKALAGSVFPYVLCGPQSASPAARAALKTYTGADRHPVS